MIELLHSGGFVMPPLVLGLFVLCFALAWRAQSLGGAVLAAGIFEDEPMCMLTVVWVS